MPEVGRRRRFFSALHAPLTIVEGDEVLTATEVEARVCAYFRTTVHEHLVQPPAKPRRGRRAAAPPSPPEAGRRQRAAHAVKPQQAA